MFWVVLIVCGMPIAIACETSWSFPSPPLIGRDGCVYILESCSTTVTPRKVFNPYYQISNGRDGRRSRRKHVYPILFFLSFLQLVISLGCNSLMTEQRTQDFDEECLVPFPSTRRSSSSSEGGGEETRWKGPPRGRMPILLLFSSESVSSFSALRKRRERAKPQFLFPNITNAERIEATPKKTTPNSSVFSLSLSLSLPALCVGIVFFYSRPCVVGGCKRGSLTKTQK